jgi:hypothetical protein
MGKNKLALLILKITAVSLICLLTFKPNPAFSQEDSQQNKFVFDLEYQSTGFNIPIHISTDEKTFEKEPNFEGKDVVRGLLLAGTEEKDYIGFIWDKTAGKIYLDLNRNRDLQTMPMGY